MTIRQYKLTPFIRQRKYFGSLIFVIEGDRRNFFRDENFLIYGTSYDVCTDVHVKYSGYRTMNELCETLPSTEHTIT